MYRKAISLRDENSSGTNGNVLLRDGSTDPLAMNSHNISADEVIAHFAWFYWNSTVFARLKNATRNGMHRIRQQMDHNNFHRQMAKGCFYGAQRMSISKGKIEKKKKRANNQKARE